MKRDAIIVKIDHKRPVVSYLLYDNFDGDPHPALFWSLLIDLDDNGIHAVKLNYYGNRESPPILHRKELFIRGDDPRWEKFARLTEQEEQTGLYENPFVIGTRKCWNKVLEEKGVRIEGHEVCAV